MKMKKILLVLVILITATFFLGGCYICIDCVCPSPQETHPQILETIYYCDLLQEYIRGWTPCAAPRELTLSYFDLVSKDDIQWGLDKIGAWGCCMSYSEIIYELRQLKGYEKVPIGYVEYSNGTILNVVVCKEEGKIRAFLLVNGKFKELISDPLIAKIVI